MRKLFAHIDPDRRDATFVAQQSAVVSERLDQLSQILTTDAKRPDGHLWLGDCGYPVTFLWIVLLTPFLGLSIEWPGEVTRYRTAVAEFRAVSAELGDYRPRLAAWLEERIA